ncbi:AMP-binding protein [Kribbella sp. NPDC051952]|uniref:AMP-binding protein n=1 Tax=Kribbella sp. NPDC051952 TaxID=3154851 RepID=UPI003437A35E
MPGPEVKAFNLPPAHPFVGQDIDWLLRTCESVYGDRRFLTWEPFEGLGRTWSYREFVVDVRRVAAGLRARGIDRGSRVLIHLDNCPEFVLSWFALASLGAIAVTTNTRAAGPELRYFAESSQVTAAITQPAYAELVSASISEARWVAVTETDAGTTPTAGPDRSSSFDALYGDPAASAREPEPGLAVLVQFTSGTTAQPKGVVWTHANALWGARVTATHQDLRRDDVHLIFLPLFHANALAYSFLPSMWAGAGVVLQPRFSARRYWPVSVKHGCTWNSTIAFAIRALSDYEIPAHSYRLWAAGTCDPPWDAQFGVRSLGWWGMTETITQGVVGYVHHPNRPMSIGRAAPEYKIDIVRPDGASVENEEPGELLIKGDRGVSLFAEYLDDPAATEGAFTETGWFSTGDRVVRHADGFITFLERLKDMLKVGGENVAASEIEQVVLGVDGVVEAAVVGAPHDMLDEVPVVFVVSRRDRAALTTEITQACADRLASFKVPREVYVVDDLPRATLQKVAKAELRRQLRN